MIKYGLTLILGFMLSIPTLIAQRFISFPFSGYDDEATIQLGLQYNLVNQNYQLNLKNNWKQLFEDLDVDNEAVTYLGDLKSVHSPKRHGFAVGIPIDIKWNETLSLNFTPSFIILNSYQIAYTAMDAEIKPLIRKSKQSLNGLQGDNYHSFELPVGFKIRSEEKNIFKSDTKYRAYLVGGVRLTKWTGLVKKYDDLIIEKSNNRPVSEALILKPEYMSWEAGVGFNFHFSYFKVSPELRFSQSMSNVLNNNHVLSRENKFMAPIDKAFIRNVYFSLIFQ